MTAAQVMPFGANLRHSASIWFASSRVGASMRTEVPRRLLSLSRCRIGSKNAAVLPVPVSAVPITSPPLNITGIACFWMGVGSVNPICSHLSFKHGCKPSSLKFICVYLFLSQPRNLIAQAAYLRGNECDLYNCRSRRPMSAFCICSSSVIIKEVLLRWVETFDVTVAAKDQRSKANERSNAPSDRY